jgi:hypothetical protein
MPKPPTNHFHWITLILLIIGIPFGALVGFLWIGVPRTTTNPLKVGVTFSQTYATSLKLDWKETLTAALDDLHIRFFRIPAYWNIVEPKQGRYDWSSMDFQLDEIAKRGGHVILSVGLKSPRWPECWMPDWARTLSTDEEHDARLRYLKSTVERYKDHPALQSWQIENEPSFRFGECPPPNLEFFKREIDLVRSIDPHHPVATTDSGELATWLAVGPQVDRLGVSVYRIVRVMWLGWVWPYDWVPPYWYARKAALVSPWVKQIYVSEFQMEPWLESSALDTPLDRQFETFTPERMKKNFDFATRMQITEIHFWGVEWWYWMKTQKNDARFWDLARDFFSRHP